MFHAIVRANPTANIHGEQYDDESEKESQLLRVRASPAEAAAVDSSCQGSHNSEQASRVHIVSVFRTLSVPEMGE
ncbi:hypothetical protein PsYK624_119470 [Phanerochaete sordida]|uniref:Uncharacterized protein n=1 Tax=Phanerochaete sordida TaxID=48140 RepID=A0A9P3GLL8_9APHY|nr:hypothetical protein PsYK624_119470 [Phanerochaete sordida]